MMVSTRVAMIAFLIGFVPLRLIARTKQTDSALTDLQAALEMDRKGEYGEALQKYQTFLSQPKVQLTPLLSAYILKQVADVDNGLGNYYKAEVNARQVLRVLASANETNTSTFATTEGALADALDGEGNYREAQNMAERALSVGRATLSPETPSFALILTVLAHSLEDEGERGRPLKLYREAVGIMKNAGKDNRIELGSDKTPHAAGNGGGRRSASFSYIESPAQPFQLSLQVQDTLSHFNNHTGARQVHSEIAPHADDAPQALHRGGRK
jgi:tetratricopeptide (TPR) repeat protein